MTEPITLEKANELLDRAVAEKGADYVYPLAKSGTCVYFQEGQPSCIVGHVLAYVGFGPEDVEEGVSAEEVCSGLGFDAFALDLLDTAQGKQDSGIPWGESVKRARAYVASYS